jgi:hypothetical protein
MSVMAASLSRRLEGVVSDRCNFASTTRQCLRPLSAVPEKTDCGAWEA